MKTIHHHLVPLVVFSLVWGLFACAPKPPAWKAPAAWPRDSLFHWKVPLSRGEDARVTLATLAEGKVTLVSMVYARCRSICPPMARAATAFREEALRPTLGTERSGVLLFTFDPAHDGPAERSRFVAEKGEPDWIFAAASPEDTRAFAALIGMRYDDQGEEIVHGSAFVLLGPDGRVIRRFADQNELRDATKEKGWKDVLRAAFASATNEGG